MGRAFTILFLLVLLASCNLIRPPRHVELDGQSNFRDVGGYRTEDGGRVQWGQVYRSGALSDLSDRDLKFIRRMGFRTVLDFRTETQIERRGADRLPVGVECIRTGGAPDARTDHAKLLRTAVDPANRPMIFHARDGAYRTGTATAVLLTALGVPWKTVRKDYLLSNKYRKRDINREVRRIRELQAKERGVPVRKINARKLKESYRLHAEDIDAFRDRIVDEYGSMHAYVIEGLGLTERELNALRRSLLQ